MMPMRIKQFELLHKIGTGGFGKVYRAFDTILERLVAIKLLRREIETDPVALENFYREARFCASLNHTNIIHIYGFDEFEGQRLLAMELADQGSLDAMIEKHGRVDELLVLDVGIKIASALDMALKHNLLHCDIKPGNILFNIENEPKLVDWGTARRVDAHVDPSAELEGTPYYVAPEKIKREPETFLSDMYSLGCTLYHAVTGHVPFEAPTVTELIQAHVEVPLTPPNQVVLDISEGTSEALAKALAKNPGDRFLSYDEFKNALDFSRSHLIVSRNTANNTPANLKVKTGWWRRG
jgi:serine/threonine-protein kinase